jgi:hypothetical protein
LACAFCPRLRRFVDEVLNRGRFLRGESVLKGDAIESLGKLGAESHRFRDNGKRYQLMDRDGKFCPKFERR